MLLSLNWLREFVPFTGETQLLADHLTMLGLEIEEIRRPFAHLESLRVGHVLTCAAHPDSDHLSVCTVDIGQGEVLPIVCGAPNVAQGQRVAVAPVGTTLPGGVHIKKAKLRGERSCGMLCSERELELGEGHEGIMTLDQDLRPGTPLVEALGLHDEVLDVSITPNRADCLSVLGLAREVAVAFQLPLTLPTSDPLEQGEPCTEFSLEADPALCSVYQARLLRGVRVGLSPAWLRYRLLSVGLRPINAIVDVTNYVLMELGQPLHAFDREKLSGAQIAVRSASEGTRFVTLDGQERQLDSRDTLIWDAVKPVALAGVMGGANSEITADSTTVLLESAVFTPALVRKTARRLGLSSESSFRFERGVDQPGSRLALDRAAAMIVKLAGGQVASGVLTTEPRPFVQKTMTFLPANATRLLGLPLEDSFCQNTLEMLGCTVETGASPWQVTAPSFRLDLEREVDLIEEVARVYGMDRIDGILPTVRKKLEDMDKEDTVFAFLDQVKLWGQGVGLTEAVNYSFVGQADLDRLGLPEDGRVCVCNPLSEDMRVLRTDLAPGLFAALKRNISQDTLRVRLFEVAHTFVQDESSDTQTRETNHLGLLLHGRRFPERYPYQNGDNAGYTDIKGLVEHFLARIGAPEALFSLAEEHPYLAPAVRITVQGREIGWVGMLRDELAEHFLARDQVWYADMNLDLVAALRHQPMFAETPRFPAVRRDITLTVAADFAVEGVLQAALGMQESLLESIYLVDIYSPAGQEERNLSFRLVFRHPERTLKDKDVDKAMERIVAHVTQILPVRFS